MYIPSSFRMTLAECQDFIRHHVFAVVVGAGPDGRLFATHLPLLYREPTPDGPLGRLVGHMARANPHWKSLPGTEVLAIFPGPHAYISPAWYGQWPAVPTWNYLAVHAGGTFALLDQAETAALLRDQVAWMEPDSPLLTQLEEPAYVEERQGVVGFEIRLDRLVGKKKLGQNRPPVERQGAIDGLRATGRPDALAVADLMAATLSPADQRAD
jgi:transcriptional regulator